VRNHLTRLAILLVLALGLGASGAWALPDGVSVKDAAAIEDVITRQLEAFKRDDAAQAYAFAGPSIRTLFPTPEIFIEMVRRGYPPVYRSRQVEFGPLAMRDGELVQTVELVGPDGSSATALYSLVRNRSGAWVISGCSLIPSTRVTT
jgi:hypothetical protein